MSAPARPFPRVLEEPIQPNRLDEESRFHCYICDEPSEEICVRCTRDACDNHICDRCQRCSDCCACFDQ